jgi:putative FmdB family regulatory protein
LVPIYEYRCENGHLTERFQRMSDPALEVCDSCSAPVKKVLHPVSIHFKGSGFYNTDYGRGKGGSASTDSKSGGESGSSGGTSSDSGSSASSTPPASTPPASSSSSSE